MSATPTCDARLAAAAVAQYGVFTRAQALAAGFSASQIERRVRADMWARVLPRVYRHRLTPVSTVLSHSAAVLWAGSDSVLSHTSAASMWRIHDERVHAPELTVCSTRAPRVAGVVVHRVADGIDRADIAHVGGLPVTTPVRTIVDLAAVLDAADLEVALQRARTRRLVTVRAVRGRLDEIGSVGRPGAARLRVLLEALGSAAVDASARMAG